MWSATRRRAMTLVELLVVVTLIGLLIALLLPAVQAAREAARRAQCSNNLKQLGIAVGGYEASWGSFPPCGHGLDYSHLTRLLPYLEAAAVYDHINFEVSSGAVGSDDPNATVGPLRIAAFLCPSDGPSTMHLGPSNYAGNIGNSLDYRNSNGAYQVDPAIRPRPIGSRDVLDGTSSSAGASEWLVGYLTPEPVPEVRLILVIHAPGQVAEDFTASCRSLEFRTLSQTDFLPSKGWSWLVGGYDTQYNHYMGINDRSCLATGATQKSALTATSNHPGGANVGFLDGHVQFMRSSTDLRVWRALGSIAGGEIVSAGEY